MGAILGALIGRHLAHTEEARARSRDFVLGALIDRNQNPTSPKYTNEQYDSSIKLGYQLGYLNKHDKPILDAHFNDIKAKWEKARQSEANDRAIAQLNGANQSQNLGTPNTNPTAAPPVTPQPQTPQASTPQGQPDASAIMQMLMAAKTAQAGGTQGGMQGSMQGPFPGASPPKLQPGMIPEPPPFANGAMAAGASGPMQQGENPKMAQAAVQGSEGFGTPPPAPAPAKPQTFGWANVLGGMDPEEYATREGRTTSIKARPTLEMQSDVARQQLPLDYAAREKLYTDKSWFRNLPEIFQAQILSGQTIPGAGAHFTIPGTTKSLPGDVDLNGDPVAPDTPHVKRTYINGKWIAQVQEVRGAIKDVLAADGSIKRIGIDPYTFKTSEPIEGLTSAAIVKELPVTHADGTVTRVGVTKTGIVVSSDARLNGFSIAAFPRQTSGLKVRDDGDGNFSLVPITTFSGPVIPQGAGGQAMPQTGVGATIPSATPATGTPATAAPVGGATPTAASPYPAGPAATPATMRTGVPVARVTGAAIPFGTRSIPPGQRITFETKAAVFDNTIDLVKSVQKRLPLLGSLIDAKKIEMQIDPAQGIVKAIVNRTVPLTPDEEKLAGDFASLTEHINTLRGPLGAAGFRGPEAFAALQQQRGNLLANPGVTKVVLENTMKALQGQHKAIRQGLDKGGVVPQWAIDMPTPESAIQNPPPGTPGAKGRDPAGIR